MALESSLCKGSKNMGICICRGEAPLRNKNAGHALRECAQYIAEDGGGGEVPCAEHEHGNIVLRSIGFKEGQMTCLFPTDSPAERGAHLNEVTLGLPERVGTTYLDFNTSNSRYAITALTIIQWPWVYCCDVSVWADQLS
jgi:hypothetical protein